MFQNITAELLVFKPTWEMLIVVVLPVLSLPQVEYPCFLCALPCVHLACVALKTWHRQGNEKPEVTVATPTPSEECGIEVGSGEW